MSSKLEDMKFEPDELQLLQAARQALQVAKSEIIELRKKVKANQSKTDDNGCKWIKEEIMLDIEKNFGFC